MTKDFPVYDSHESSIDAHCFNCGDWFDKLKGVDSGYPKGRGQFFSQCCGCGMKTFYDIRQKEAA